MRGFLTAGRLLTAGLLVLAAVIVLLVWPSGQYIFLPDPAHPVAPLVAVQGGHDPTRGEVLFVDVVVRKATWLERLFHGIRKGASYYPASEIDPKGVSQAGLQAIDRQDMQRSQKIAAAVALKALGKKVTMRPGATQLTVMPIGPSSRASDLAQPVTPGRIVFERPRCGVGSFTAVEVMQTTRAAGLRSRCGRQRRTSNTAGRRRSR